MNKLKWVILIIYASSLALFRSMKLGLLSYLPVKKDIYVSVWFGGLANNIIQLAHVEYLSKRFGFTIHIPPHSLLRVGDKYKLHNIKPREFQQSSYFPSTSSTVIYDLYYSHGRRRPLSLARHFRCFSGCSGSSTYCHFLPSLPITGMCYDMSSFPSSPSMPMS
jgi:hypothetical protein